MFWIRKYDSVNMLTVHSIFSKFVSSVPSCTSSLSLYIPVYLSQHPDSLPHWCQYFSLFLYSFINTSFFAPLCHHISFPLIDFIYTYLGPMSFFHLPSLGPTVGLNGKNYAQYQFPGCWDTSWFEVASFRTSVYAEWFLDNPTPSRKLRVYPFIYQNVQSDKKWHSGPF